MPRKTKDRDLPKHITETNYNSYQVRIVRDRIEYSSAFSWVIVGKSAALDAAVKWRDLTLALLPPPVNAKGAIRLAPAKHKKTQEPLGVTRYVTTDRRSGTPRQYLRFGVSYLDENGQNRIKAFQAGSLQQLTPDDIFHTAQTAYAFREEWEYSFLRGLPFNRLLKNPTSSMLMV